MDTEFKKQLETTLTEISRTYLGLSFTAISQEERLYWISKKNEVLELLTKLEKEAK